MLFPIKINSLKYYKNFSKNESFSEENAYKYIIPFLLKKIKILNFFKTSSQHRHLQTQNYIINNLNLKDKIVLDCGVSDASSSMYLINKKLNILKHYYLTDNFIDIKFKISKKSILLFYNNEPILYFNKYLLIFIADIKNFFLKSIIKYKINYKFDNYKKFYDYVFWYKIEKKFSNNKNITFLKYDIFTPWKHNNVDIIIIGNVLNKSYFSDKKIIESLKNLNKNLNNNGYLIIIDNIGKSDQENSSIFKKYGNYYSHCVDIKNGTRIKKLIYKTFKIYPKNFIS